MIFTTHPIQYQAPWFRALARRSDLRLHVAFLRIPSAAQQGRGFGVEFEWDIPLVDGYAWTNLDIPEGLGAIPAAWLACRRAIRAHNPDFVVVTGWNDPGLIVAAAAAKVNGRRLVCRGESTDLPRRSLPIRALHRLYLRLFDGFIAIGRRNTAFYRAHGVSAAKIVFGGYGVDHERFRAVAERERENRARYRKSWGLDSDAFTFLFAGKLEPKKRIVDLLAAMRLRAPEDPHFQLLIVGDGKERKMAEQYALEHKLPVAFAGFLNQSRMPAAYIAADALVLLSDYGETWGLVVNEAMACGLPCIVSDRVGCAPDLVHAGDTGFVVPFGDVGAIATALVKLAASPAQAASMGERGRALVEKDYSIGRTATATAEAGELVSKT